MPRPEKYGSAIEYYTEDEIYKYTRNTHIRKIQQKMTIKCLEYLELKNGNILDIGCGSGFSMDSIINYCTENEIDYKLIGIDINKNMLKVCQNIIKETLICCDIAKDLPFFPGSFDYIISISCINWLLYPTNKEKVVDRLKSFFSFLFPILKKDGTAIFQFYFESKWQYKLLLKEARKSGFLANILADGEGKNKKYYLFLDQTRKKRKIKFMDESENIKNKKKKISEDSSSEIFEEKKTKKNKKRRRKK